MTTYFLKSFDELLDVILTDYKNQFPEADTSQGSLIYIKSACMSSALWGLYKYQDWISRQIFPDTADTVNLEHHAWVRGLARTYGETDSAYLARLLDLIRRPPAGGNKYDYVKWALSVDNVAAAYCFPLAQGLGTVDVVLVANKTNTGSEVPSSYADITGSNTAVTPGKLVDAGADFSAVKAGDKITNNTAGTETTVAAPDSGTQLSLSDDIFTATPQDYTIQSLTTTVKTYIDDIRPVTASVVRVMGPTIVTQAVTMTVTGSGVNLAQISADIQAYINTLGPGQTLYKSQLLSIAIQNGAANAAITVPAADVVPATYEMIRPGVISAT